MADTEQAVMDSPQTEGQVQDGSNGGKQSPFLHTWQSKEVAEKGVTDLIAQRDENQRRMQMAESRAAQAEDLVKKLSESLTSPARSAEAEKEREDVERQLARLKEDLADPDKAPEILIDFIRSVKSESATIAEAKIKEAEQRFNEMLKTVSGKVDDYDPDFRSAKELVERAGLKDDVGNDRQAIMQAAKLLKKVMPKPPEQRASLPGSSRGMSSSAGDDGDDHDGTFKVLESMPGIGKLTPTQKDILRKQWSAKR